MARIKEYDRDDVLEKAVGVFWRQGYKATSVMDIVQATGLNTASMYKEFGDKDGLFEQALEHYRQNVLSPRFRLLIDAPDITGVEAFLENVAAGAASEEYKGCLMMNHLAQTHSISPQAVRQISDFCTEMEGLLEAALRNAQTNGDIPGGRDPAVLARLAMCFVHGLVLYGRHQDKKDDIPSLYDVVLEAVTG
jgi:TetR/AcrR family transcriptional regulator, transcriptional repressor for nem operon